MMKYKPLSIIVFFCVFLIFSQQPGARPLPIADQYASGSEKIPGSGLGNEMLQFTAGEHVLGFRTGDMFIVSGDHALRITFVNATPIFPKAENSSRVTSDPGQSAKFLEKVTYEELWPGITLVYEKHTSGVVKSTYHIEPNEDRDAVSQIRLKYNVPVELDENGNLILTFETGQMKESCPVAWQDIKKKRVPVDVSFKSLDKNEVGFEIGDHDPRYPLVIDPVLSWNTFMGGAFSDAGYSIAIDTDGNIYVTGFCTSTWGSPVNPYSGLGEAFAVKFDNSGVIVWNTFIGGGLWDYGIDITLDSDRNVYVVGYSTSNWGSPVTAHTGGASNDDAFVAKLNNNGVRQWNTFMGSTSTDDGSAIAVDSSGNVYVTGHSGATWGAAPVNAFAGGIYADGYAAKLNSLGVLQWNTFMGATYIDYGDGIAVDSAGNVYVVGSSGSTWGTPVNAHAGAMDAFVLKLNSSGARQWNTFMGNGLNNDYGYDVVMDSARNIYVTGWSTESWGTPIQAHSGGFSDAFVVKLDNNGARQWSTFMGGSIASTYGESIALDSSGNIYVCGESHKTWGSPANAHSGSWDVFAAKLFSDGTRHWNTFLGGTQDDYGNGIVVDQVKDVYLSGSSRTSWGSPINPHSGDSDAFTAKLGIPDMNIISGSKDYLNSSAYDFGLVSIDGTSNNTFTIESLGTGNLILTGSPEIVIKGKHKRFFSVQQQPESTIPPGNSSDFVIRFSPMTKGQKAARLSIDNNDVDKTPYLIYLYGEGYKTAPEIHIKQNGMDITDGGSFDYGTLALGNLRSRTFKIENLGDENLNLTGTPFVKISGTNAAEFEVPQQPSSPVTPGSNTDFIVRFNPNTAGDKTAMLIISNNDEDENPYNIQLQGTCEAPADDPPTVEITSPVDGVVVYGQHLVTATAADDIGVTKVEFYIDNVLKHTDTTAPYSFLWNVNTETAGTHMIKAKAHDTSTQTAEDVVTVTTNNMSLTLTVSREVESAWLISREYGQVNLTINNMGGLDVARFVIYRSLDGGEFTAIHEFTPDEFIGNAYSFNDTFLDETSTYTYRVVAFNAAGVPIGASNDSVI